MYRRDDPRLRRTLDQFSHNVGTATETAQEGLYSFSQNYIGPCLSSVATSFRSCTESCFPQDERRRRQRGQSRGRAEANFDFYDDWEEDENDALLGWGNSSDELNSLISSNNQPSRERALNYGTQHRARRKSVGPIDDGAENVIAGSNYIGFLERLPWNLGRRALRYKPSAADLRPQPSAIQRFRDEDEPLIEDSEEEFASPQKGKHKRNRSLTESSGHTIDSLSSRGDLFPSEDEDDAVPLDDEFALALERRSTRDDHSSGKSRPRHNKSGSRLSSRTVSSKSIQSQGSRKASDAKRRQATPEPPTISELKAEEDYVRREEEAEVSRKRDAAQKLASKRGLGSGRSSKSATRSSSPKPEMTDLGSKSPSSVGTFPFPTIDPPAESTKPRSELDLGLESTPEIEEAEEDPLALPRSPTHAETETFTPAALPRFLHRPPDL